MHDSILPLIFALAGCGGGRVVRTPIEPPPPFVHRETVSAPAQQVRADSPVRFVPAVSTPVPDEIRPQPTDREVKDTLASINKLLDAYFDFNAYRLCPDAIEAVAGAAAILKQHMNGDPTIKLLIEGHCDERGSAEFNLALGDRRAESVRGLLAQLGIDSGRIHTISFGETRPESSDATEDCWQKNRRAHIRHER